MNDSQKNIKSIKFTSKSRKNKNILLKVRKNNKKQKIIQTLDHLNSQQIIEQHLQTILPKDSLIQIQQMGIDQYVSQNVDQILNQRYCSLVNINSQPNQNNNQYSFQYNKNLRQEPKIKDKPRQFICNKDEQVSNIRSKQKIKIKTKTKTKTKKSENDQLPITQFIKTQPQQITQNFPQQVYETQAASIHIRSHSLTQKKYIKYIQNQIKIFQPCPYNLCNCFVTIDNDYIFGNIATSQPIKNPQNKKSFYQSHINNLHTQYNKHIKRNPSQKIPKTYEQFLSTNFDKFHEKQRNVQTFQSNQTVKARKNCLINYNLKYQIKKFHNSHINSLCKKQIKKDNTIDNQKITKQGNYGLIKLQLKQNQSMIQNLKQKNKKDIKELSDLLKNIKKNKNHQDLNQSYSKTFLKIKVRKNHNYINMLGKSNQQCGNFNQFLQSKQKY